MGALENPGTGCGCGGTQSSSKGPCGDALPDSPDCAIHYHYGMLLGVDDFRTEQGFHVGRLRRHQRALHGFGVVHGYAVSFDAAQRQLKVGAGYALDRLGRDLQLAEAQCLDLAAWWQLHREDEAFADIADKDDASFDAEILLCYRNCLSRAVPAIADACAPGSANLAYSRICEAPQLLLVRRKSGAASEAPLAPYHLLRLLGGLDAPARDAQGCTLSDDVWLAAQLAAIAMLAKAQLPAARAKLWQAASARAAAATTDPLPQASWPPPDDAGDGSGRATADCLVLARLSGVHLHKNGDVLQAEVGGIDIDGRQTLLPAQLLQQLPVFSGSDVLPATGPLLKSGGAQVSGTQLTLRLDRALDAASVQSGAFVCSQQDAAGQWQDFTLSAAAYDNAQQRVSLTLDHAPAAGRALRVGIRGSGAAALRGSDGSAAGIQMPDGQGSDFFFPVSGV
ncbi:hypothetical protein SAMN04488038_10137 [Solimonas aquatica]|uniref:Uncharacterized protein n=1 Tax=Solimonas aquatica TaxID=489703 RepID=A0A1H8ZHC4_9GAMM|nr:hypothetical protein [Solimonas aquatica]SEP63693.1 hypothetical protein SAMN04488038_10137 [Solimonas aquatica]